MDIPVPTRADCFEVVKQLLKTGRIKGITNTDINAVAGVLNGGPTMDKTAGRDLVKYELARESGLVPGTARKVYDLIPNAGMGIVLPPEDDLRLVHEAVDRAAVPGAPASVVEVKVPVSAPLFKDKPGEKIVETVVEVDKFKLRIEAERDELKEKLKILDAKHQAIVKEFNEAECELKIVERILRY